MEKTLMGLTHMNIDICSACDKDCWYCGRREREKIRGNQGYGLMDFDLIEKIANQTPSGLTVAFHNDGESLLHPKLGDVIKLYNARDCITYIVTNAKKLVKKADELIDNLAVMSISVIEDDEDKEVDHQVEQIREFIKLKGDRKPMITIRFVGKVPEHRYDEFNVMKVRRAIHLPKGSIGYTKPPVIPEHGICMELLNRLAIDRYGYVSVCVRFDPEGELRIGNVKDESLIDLWNGDKRKYMLQKFIDGKRDELGYCGKKCTYWGVPNGG